MFGAGLYMAGLGLLAAAIGLLVRHTAAAISIVLALVFIIGQVVQLIPGTFGEWVMKLMPGNAGPGIVSRSRSATTCSRPGPASPCSSARSRC